MKRLIWIPVILCVVFFALTCTAWAGGVFTVTYDANGGENAPAPQRGAGGSPLVLSQQVPSRPGYRFYCWSTSPVRDTDGAPSVPGSQRFMPGDTVSGGYNLYAAWVSDGWQSGDFEYEVSGSGAVITGWWGEDSVVSLPTSIGGYPVKKLGDEAMSYLEEGAEHVIIPEGVTAIGELAFYTNISTRRVTLPSTLTTLGYGCFMECASLERIRLPEKIKKIPPGAFDACYSLEEIYIPQSVTSIAKNSIPRLTVIYGQKGSYAQRWAKKNGYTFRDAGQAGRLYAITYDANGGSGAPKTQYGLYGEEILLSAGTPVRSGYAFAGWSVSPNKADRLYYPGEAIYSGMNKDVTLYASWAEPSPAQYQYGQYITLNGTIRQKRWRNNVGDRQTSVFLDLDQKSDFLGIRCGCIPTKIPTNHYGQTTIQIRGAYSAYYDKKAVSVRGRLSADGGTIYISTHPFLDDAQVTVLPGARSVRVSQSKLRLYPGQSYRLSASVLPEDAPQGVRFSSSQSSVVSVSADGTLNALKKGSAVITVKAHNGKQAKCRVEVLAPGLESIHFTNAPSNRLILSQSYQLEVSALPGDQGDIPVSWKSSNPAVARVSAGGVVTPVSRGVTKITASIQSASGRRLSASCQVQVGRNTVLMLVDQTDATLVRCAGHVKRMFEARDRDGIPYDVYQCAFSSRAAMRAAILRYFGQQNSRFDTLVLYTLCHGGEHTDEDGHTLALHGHLLAENGDTVGPEQLAAYLAPYQGDRLYLTASCYSGRFDEIMAQVGWNAIVSSAHNRAADMLAYFSGVFDYYVCEGGGHNVALNARARLRADANGDGDLTVLELAKYARKKTATASPGLVFFDQIFPDAGIVQRPEYSVVSNFKLFN